VRIAGDFLAEGLSAYEMAFRGFKEKNAALRHINEALEQEARRIALMLHDEVGQSLFAAQLALSDLNGRIDPAQQKHLKHVENVINRVEEQIRSLSHEVRPTILEDLGLVPALEFLAQGISKRHRISVAIRSSVRNRLPPPVEVALFRVVQEALSNVIRHSNAEHAQVALEQEGRSLKCTVSDTGTGFDAASPHGVRDGLGLTGIRERLDSIGGEFRIQSQPGRGTRLIMVIPNEV
jgi:signal transduction histidine kinase